MALLTLLSLRQLIRSIYLSIALMPCCLMGTLPKLSLFQHSLSAHCLFIAKSLSPVLIHSIDPFHWVFLPYTLSLNPATLHFLHKIIFIHSYHISKSSQRTMFKVVFLNVKQQYCMIIWFRQRSNLIVPLISTIGRQPTSWGTETLSF